MGYVGRDALLAKRHDTVTGFPEEDVEVAGMGYVRVRGLSRHEVIHLQSVKGIAAVERATVSLGLVEPQMTEDEVRQWQKVSIGGELDPVTSAIGRLSGMLPDAPKQAYKDFEVDPGSEFRVLPGDEAGRDDGSGDAPPDEQ